MITTGDTVAGRCWSSARNFYIGVAGTTSRFPKNPDGTTRHCLTERRTAKNHFSVRCSDGASSMSWILLFFAGLFEIGWAIGLKYTDGFSKLVPTVLTVASMVVSLALLGLALKALPVGTAYAVWTGIGTVGTALLGIWLLGEPATAIRLACIALIVCGIMGLKFAA
jgi:quaternary ammonium compound-resistance protein SugE